MKGEDKPLLKLMDGSENRFIIPVYQRNYDWGASQCKQLFSDLIDIVKFNMLLAESVVTTIAGSVPLEMM